jgi:hypothetical protein
MPNTNRRGWVSSTPPETFVPAREVRPQQPGVDPQTAHAILRIRRLIESADGDLRRAEDERRAVREEWLARAATHDMERRQRAEEDVDESVGAGGVVVPHDDTAAATTTTGDGGAPSHASKIPPHPGRAQSAIYSGSRTLDGVSAVTTYASGADPRRGAFDDSPPRAPSTSQQFRSGLSREGAKGVAALDFFDVGENEPPYVLSSSIHPFSDATHVPAAVAAAASSPARGGFGAGLGPLRPSAPSHCKSRAG